MVQLPTCTVLKEVQKFCLICPHYYTLFILFGVHFNLQEKKTVQGFKKIKSLGEVLILTSINPIQLQWLVYSLTMILEFFRKEEL